MFHMLFFMFVLMFHLLIRTANILIAKLFDEYPITDLRSDCSNSFFAATTSRKPAHLEAMAPKGTTKKPASKGVLKKPVAGNVTTRGLASSLLQNLQEEEHTQQAETRDRLKQHQWTKNWDNIPEAVQEAYKANDRAGKTQLVNNLIKRDDKGNYYFDRDNSLLQEINTRFKTKYAEKSQKAQIKAVVVTQCGGQQKLGFLMKDINGDTSLIYG